MADTDTETLPNGVGALSIEEEERLKQRPADIDADVREMERRKRVEALMSSKMFREELERVLDQQMHEGNDAPLLQRIREMVGGRLHTGSLRGPSCVLPINDIRGIEGIGYEKGEKILRCKLAAVYRLVDLFGWTQTGLNGQITARLNTAVEQVLTSPRGLLPHEVTASSLVKVDMQGGVQDQGTTNFPINVEGFSLHAAVHAARPDVRCVLHVRSAAALAISCMKDGLLPLCHEAALLGEIAYHCVPQDGVMDNAAHDTLVRALGPAARVVVLRGAGALCCGATLEEAFQLARALAAAADVQLRLAAVPRDCLALLDERSRAQIYEANRKPPAEGGKWRVGGEEFEGLMRMLDNAGFRTGYIYRHPLVKNDVPKPKNDVEVPPAVSSLGYLLEEEEMYKQGLWKKGGKTGERTRWLNSPNVYQKVEVLETGTNDPKKITKWVDANNDEWVQDGSPAHSSTPVKIDTLQFVPKNTNPKEFKQLQQQIKDNRRADKISAGPQSHILEGVTWDEASKLVGEDAVNTHTGDHVVLMGAASKGIIQRGYQHNATMYSAPYARNPFDHVTDTEIDEYRRIVERKQRSDYDTDFSESEPISAAQITSPASAPSETEEESRDEHRVLRIETKQVPVRSQPEVVLSDVDTTDFLNAERVHADRIRGTNAKPDKEVLSVNKRSQHEYIRNINFDNVLQMYEDKPNPRCKQNLNPRLNGEEGNGGNYSSRSSLYSIPSIEWDGRCRSEYALRTRSLPRKPPKLFRTRSHSGFINTSSKDPEPTHFHLPRCMSCGATNNSYAWELSKSNPKLHAQSSIYRSFDSLPQKCEEVVRVKEVEVPVYKVEREFVESQEFTEDNYLGDIGSFSSENQTVIETTVLTSDTQDNGNVSVGTNKDIYRAEIVTIGTDAKEDETLGSTEGEYLSFTDLEDSYESPVKELVEKDIRDYSVPIDCYCDDFGQKGDARKSPLKRELPNILEPILEESKSSYGDESNDKNVEITTDNAASAIDNVSNADSVVDSKIVNDVDSKVQNKDKCDNVIIAVGDAKLDISHINFKAHLTMDSCTLSHKDDAYEIDAQQIRDDVNCCEHNEEKANVTDKEVALPLVSAYVKLDIPRPSEEYSAISSDGPISFNSTVEFEKYEIISEILVALISKINFDDNAFFDAVGHRHVNIEFDISEKNTSFEKLGTDKESEIDTYSQYTIDRGVEILKIPEDYEEIVERDSLEMGPDSNAIEGDTFSIAKMIEHIENNYSVSTDTSVLDRQTDRIIEGVLYYLFDRVMYISNNKNKIKKCKQVVTVVDSEDILYTTDPHWLIRNNSKEFELKTDTAKDQIRMTPTDHTTEVVLQSKLDVPIENEPLNYSATEEICMNFNPEYDDDDVQNECSENYHKFNETFYVECDATDNNNNGIEYTDEVLPRLHEAIVNDINELDMNTAFLEDYQRSSPNNSVVFENCTESPIKRDLIYNKDDSLLESPFVKKAQVIAMSQTANKGGIKYWLSFDDSINEMDVRSLSKSRKNFEESFPSFIAIDHRKERRSGLLSDFSKNTVDSPRCSVDFSDHLVHESDTTLFELHAGPKIRMYSSWPPFEKTLFYRILSKFRMSESFNPSDLDNSRLENSF